MYVLIVSSLRRVAFSGFILLLFDSGDNDPELGRFTADAFGLFAAKGGVAVGFAAKRVPVTP